MAVVAATSAVVVAAMSVEATAFGVGLVRAAGRDRDQRCADDSVCACPGHPAFPLWDAIRCSSGSSLLLFRENVNRIGASAAAGVRRGQRAVIDKEYCRLPLSIEIQISICAVNQCVVVSTGADVAGNACRMV